MQAINRWIFFSLVLPLLTAPCAAARGDSEHFITVGSVQRRYLLHLPPGFDRKRPAPLILMLHGGGGTPEHSGQYYLAEAADPKGFVIAYPEGIARHWNDGRSVTGNDNDDVGFLSALIDELVRDDNIDPKRVYAAGMSNGGFMSFTLACRLSEKIAAIAPIAGSMGEDTLPDCKPQRPVPVLMINGTADPLVRFEGGPVTRNRGRSEPISKVVEFWRRVDCGKAAVRLEIRDLPDTNTRDDSSVRVTTCHGTGAEVANYTVEGGGHTWPGGSQYLPKRWIGPVNRDFNASKTIVEFFDRH